MGTKCQKNFPKTPYYIKEEVRNSNLNFPLSLRFIYIIHSSCVIRGISAAIGTHLNQRFYLSSQPNVSTQSYPLDGCVVSKASSLSGNCNLKQRNPNRGHLEKEGELQGMAATWKGSYCLRNMILRATEMLTQKHLITLHFLDQLFCNGFIQYFTGSFSQDWPEMITKLSVIELQNKVCRLLYLIG